MMNREKISPDEKGRIQKEIEEVLKALIAGCEVLDMEMAFGMFSDSPEFLMMGTDGSLCDYQTYLNDNINYLTSCSSFDLTTFRKEIRVLDRSTATLAWAYKAEATLKTGERDIFEKAGASFVFRKMNGEWKVVYYHESTAPPIHIPATE
jgi:hypothetical protein